MSDWDRMALAFDVLDNADVMHEFDEHVLLRVDRDIWEQFSREVYGMEAAE